MGKVKPNKPRKDFPLFPHQNGQWAKKIRGKLHYFGAWNFPREAESQYLDVKDYLQAGRRPPAENGGLCSMRDLCNRFLTSKKALLDAGEIRRVTFQDYRRTCDLLISYFGRDVAVEDLSVSDFEGYRGHLSKTRGLVALGNEINRGRIVFKYAYDADLIEKPVRFGQTFRQPSRKSIRVHRQKLQQKHGPRMFEASDIRQILKAATQPMQAMVFLGINGGLGAADLSALPHSALDLKNGWLNYPRPKTGIERRIPLWPETIQSLQKATSLRTDKRLVFITRDGNAYQRILKSGAVRSSIMEQFSKLIERLGLKRHGLGFYALRHTFETVAGESKDQVAVDAIMGHVDQSMAALYRERISDTRLLDAVNCVRTWLDLDTGDD